MTALPFPNVIAGVLIGLTASLWEPLLTACLGWSVVWTAVQFLFRGREQLAAMELPPEKRGLQLTFNYLSHVYGFSLWNVTVVALVTVGIRSLF